MHAYSHSVAVNYYTQVFIQYNMDHFLQIAINKFYYMLKNALTRIN